MYSNGLGQYPPTYPPGYGQDNRAWYEKLAAGAGSLLSSIFGPQQSQYPMPGSPGYIPPGMPGYMPPYGLQQDNTMTYVLIGAAVLGGIFLIKSTKSNKT